MTTAKRRTIARILNVSLSLIFATAGSQASAQGREAPGFDIEGMIDILHQVNLNGQRTTGLRSFDAVNNVTEIQWAELSVRKKIGSIAGRIDLAFGHQADVLAGLTVPLNTANPAPAALSQVSEPTRNIAQAFMTYNPSLLPELTVTAGKFYSPIGLEVPRAKDNWNYSRSLTYSFGAPAWHQGLGLTYRILPDQLQGSLFVLNGWDGRIVNEANQSQTFALTLNATPAKALTVNYGVISGTESGDSSAIRQAHDLNATYTINELIAVSADVLLGLQKNYAAASGTVDARYTGWSLYGKFTPIGPLLSLAARVEQFDDQNGAALGAFAPGGTPLKVTSLTGTVGLALGDNFETRFEYRTDHADKATGLLRDRDGKNADNESTVAIGLIVTM